MKVLGQTLFLGASVVSFSSNIGWGGSSSSITVELIEDVQPFGKVPFRKFDQSKSADYSELNLVNDKPLPSGHPGNITLGNDFYNINHYVDRGYQDNHYYECTGDDCYVDELGRPYSSSTTKKEKNIPGKIYYEWVGNKFVSKYWYAEDPGFFATGTRISPDGSYNASLGRDILASNLYIYDIINTPVYFKFDNFEFIGLVKDWERSNKPGGITYTVTIESFDNLLDNCQVILDKYGGSIFGRQGINKGTPVNDINIDSFDYTATLAEGSIPNIFNVYGFLESFGIDFFGGSNYNDNGISANDVIKGLSALTSSHNRLDRDAAFSPYGRILTKTIANISGEIARGITSFGVISPLVGTNRNVVGNPTPGNYNSFSLDISDIGNLVPDYRISGSQSITSLLRNLSEVTGTDYLTRVIPAMNNDALYQFVIKVISVDRKSHRSPYNIRSIVTNLEQQNYNISNSSFGQELNDNVTNKFIIGGPQQRLLQVKNYRLPYNQTSYAYNPTLKKFISLNKPSNKMRVPSVMSTRHVILSNLLFGPYLGDRININDLDRDSRFFTLDNTWRDTEVTFTPSDSEYLVRGNYNYSFNNLVKYNSYIMSSGDLNKDTKSRTPDKPCTPGQLPEGQTLDSHFIDNSCTYYTEQPCPSKERNQPKCSETPDQEGGAKYQTDRTEDSHPDFEEGGFVPITGYDQPVSRYLNLHNDFISPYFGRALEEKIPVSDDTNEYRAVRPVFLDIWTNQIVVGFNMHELPQLSIGEPISLYDTSFFKNQPGANISTGGLQRGTSGPAAKGTPPVAQGVNPGENGQWKDAWQPTVVDGKRTHTYSPPGFVITESEMRASESFDSYFSYCLGKSRLTKPDLFLMLLNAYKTAGILYEDMNTYGANLNNINSTSTGGLSRPLAAPSNNNISFNGITKPPANGLRTNLQMNWSAFLNHNFVKDLQIICSFIKSIADKYYGRKYLVKLPDMVLYRDAQYASIRIPSRFDTISVYAGSNKIFGNYSLATDGAWEEPGNFIDDCIVVGDNISKTFMDENNLIGPIAGYNNSLNIDDVRKTWCERDLRNRLTTLYGYADSLINTVAAEISKIYGESSIGLESGGIIDSSIIEQIDKLIEKIQKELQVVALKELQQLGQTINCIPVALMRKIFDSWNSLVSSIVSDVKKSVNNPESNRLSKLPAQWKKLLQQSSESISNDLKILDFGVPSLDLAGLGGDEDYVIVPVSPKKEPFGRMSPRSSKLFKKCNAERIIFMNLINFTDPRAIMTVDKIDIYNTSLSYVKDPSTSVIANIAIEDSAFYIRLKNRLNQTRESRNDALDAGDETEAAKILDSINVLSQEVNYIRMLKQYIVPEIDPRYLIAKEGSANPSVGHIYMSPKAAHPYFFAVPLTNNQVCYGPWTNYVDNVVPQPYINNIIHKTHIDYNPELVPWRYGSTSLLDKAVSYLLNTDINYQTILERGRVSIAGPPIFGIGGVFHDNFTDIPNTFKFDNSRYRTYYASYKFLDVKRNGYRDLSYDCIKIIHREVSSDGPLISNIGIQVGTEGIITTYSFQTYNPKTALYNKTYSDAISERNKDVSKLQTAINNVYTSLSSKINKERADIYENAKRDRRSDKQFTGTYKTRLYGQSPIEIFVGQGVESLKSTAFSTELNNISIKDPGDNPLPLVGNTPSGIEKFLNQRKNYSWVGGVMGIEIGAELREDYNSKSAMSLDGLLSPISFYPTIADRTYSMSTYAAGSGIPIGDQNTDTFCPVCGNTRKIKNLPYVNYHNENTATIKPESIEIVCPVCSRSKILVEKKDKDPLKKSGKPDVNIYSLNPVVVSSGEFRNPYASIIDRCRHSIGAISRGEYNPLDDSFYINDNINTYISGYNPDFSRFDMRVKRLENRNILLNQRFMSLRGPLMLHGWGFDTDGYPVPNALDMPYKLDKYGRPLRFQLYTENKTDKDKNKFGFNDLDKPGMFIIPDSNKTESETPILGDIITNRYEWKGTGDGTVNSVGKWTKKTQPSKQFYLNWAERQDTWPVGPIDLRWDHKRRVWDASGGCKEEVLPPFIVTDKNDLSTLSEFLENRTEDKCPYKMVYLTLEQDMTRELNFESTNPARAFIDDIEYSKEPLQNNYRRLVYIIDSAGYTAPRGAKLLCRYNRDNGFYEPITKPILTALGTINGSEARIEMSYTQGRRSGVMPVFSTNFSNPLNLIVGTKGLFNYINGQWTLISTG